MFAMNVAKIISAFGGTTAMAELFRITPGAVSQWRKAGIPIDKMEILIQKAPSLFGCVAKAPMDREATVPMGYGSWRELIMSRRRIPAARAVAKAIKNGSLPNPKTLMCVDCGAPAVCYEHRDYRKPLDVDPVCKRCDCIRGTAMPDLHINSKEYAQLLEETKAAYKGKVRKNTRLPKVKLGAAK
jgi:hypothetical protein